MNILQKIAKIIATNCKNNGNIAFFLKNLQKLFKILQNNMKILQKIAKKCKKMQKMQEITRKIAK